MDNTGQKPTQSDMYKQFCLLQDLINRIEKMYDDTATPRDKTAAARGKCDVPLGFMPERNFYTVVDCTYALIEYIVQQQALVQTNSSKKTCLVFPELSYGMGGQLVIEHYFSLKKELIAQDPNHQATETVKRFAQDINCIAIQSLISSYGKEWEDATVGCLFVDLFIVSNNLTQSLIAKLPTRDDMADNIQQQVTNIVNLNHTTVHTNQLNYNSHVNNR